MDRADDDPARLTPAGPGPVVPGSRVTGLSCTWTQGCTKFLFYLLEYVS